MASNIGAPFFQKRDEKIMKSVIKNTNVCFYDACPLSSPCRILELIHGFFLLIFQFIIKSYETPHLYHGLLISNFSMSP